MSFFDKLKKILKKELIIETSLLKNISWSLKNWVDPSLARRKAADRRLSLVIKYETICNLCYCFVNKNSNNRNTHVTLNFKSCTAKLSQKPSMANLEAAYTSLNTTPVGTEMFKSYFQTT